MQTPIPMNNLGGAEVLEDMSIDDVQQQTYLKDKIPAKLRHFMEMDNIADDLSKEQLTKIAEVCLDGYEIDKASRADWEEVMSQAFQLVDGSIDEKNTPWPGAANIKYPLVTGACIQFNARTNPEIIKNERVVEVRRMVPDDAMHSISNRADRLSAHMSYQLLGQSKHWVRDTDKLLMMLPMMGTVFRKSFFNTITGQPDTTLCLPDDIVINQKTQSLEDAQRVSHVLYMTSNDIVGGMRAGIYLDYPLGELKGSVVNAPDSVEIQDLPDDSRIPQSYTASKESSDETTDDVVHECIEQHRWLDLDGDDYQEPYIVTVHKTSQKILRIVARYDESCFEFNEKGQYTKINAINYFTDYHFIPNPNGNFYSLGFGLLLLATNETVNSVLNQLLDAGTLANRQGGFLGSELRLEAGQLSFVPGEWKKVYTAPGTTISQNIVPLPIKEPSATLFQLMQFLIESSKQITNVTDIMAGEMPNPNQPATTTMAMLEQSQQIYSGVLYRIHDSLQEEFEKLYGLNKKYLKEEETFPLAEETGIITRKDYELPGYGVFPVADPKLSSNTQRMVQAQAILDLTRYPQINAIPALENYLQVLKVPNTKDYIIVNAPPSPEDQKTMAEKDKIVMDMLCALLDRELKASSIAVDEIEQKSKIAYYGTQAAASKIDSAVKLAEALSEEPQEVAKAAIGSEAVSRRTQANNYPADAVSKLETLQQMIGQLLMMSQQKLLPPPQQPQPGGAKPDVQGGMA